MKALVAIVSLAGLIWIIFLLIRSKIAVQERKFTTSGDISSIVSSLERSGGSGSFVVFMFHLPGDSDEDLPNFQYSIENKRLGFDWVLLAPRNIKDEAELTEFISKIGYTATKHSMNGVNYVRVEGKGVESLGSKVLKDFYDLPLDVRLEIITEGFQID